MLICHRKRRSVWLRSAELVLCKGIERNARAGLPKRRCSTSRQRAGLELVEVAAASRLGGFVLERDAFAQYGTRAGVVELHSQSYDPVGRHARIDHDCRYGSAIASMIRRSPRRTAQRTISNSNNRVEFGCHAEQERDLSIARPRGHTHEIHSKYAERSRRERRGSCSDVTRETSSLHTRQRRAIPLRSDAPCLPARDRDDTTDGYRE